MSGEKYKNWASVCNASPVSCHTLQICGCRDQRVRSDLPIFYILQWVHGSVQASLWAPMHTVSMHKALGQKLKVLHLNCASYENLPPFVTSTCKFHLMSPSLRSGRDREQTALPYSFPCHARFYISLSYSPSVVSAVWRVLASLVVLCMKAIPRLWSSSLLFSELLQFSWILHTECRQTHYIAV